ncbi:unnamed protein product [Lymnaea stagnalis]|uniref:Uncharacterized protein n=1 Tax=Lymnaea stagnalis TaxID=6523 RepID=A0AAV2HJY2_LYMST
MCQPKMSTNHNPVQLLCLILTLFVTIVTTLVVFSSLARQYNFQEPLPNLLLHDLEYVATTRPSPISPASWIHPIWVVILLWQLLWSVYGIICIFLKTSGVPLYTSPVLFSVPVLLIFDFACGFVIAWFILYDRLYTSISCPFILVTSLLTWISFGFSTHSLRNNVYRLEKSERRAEIWIHRLLVQNGLAALATWAVFVLAYNITLALIHHKDIKFDGDNSSTVGLSVIGAFQLLYLLLDVTCIDRSTRYTVTPYIVSIVALSACLFRLQDWVTDDVKFIYLATLLCFAFLSLLIKATCVACRIMRPTCGGGDLTTMNQASTSETEAHYLLK